MRDGASWTGFLVMAFAVLGLVGALATYAAQIPFARALARSATLDQVLADAGSPSRLAALRPALGESAAVLAGPPAALPARVAAERVRIFAAAGREQDATGLRLRIVLAAFTAACALFGAAVLSVVRRARPH